MNSEKVQVNINNLTLMTDSYKLLHWQMYPENTEEVYSYFESRSGATFNKTVFFGAQYLIKEYLMRGITKDDIEEGEYITENHLGNKSFYNRAMWEYILSKYGGKIPLRIKAVPEGTPVDVSNVLMSVENTDDACAGLTNHFETLLTHVWGPSTVATLSREVKILCKHYLEKTSDIVDDHLAFMLHDFGFRGVNMAEAAGIGGLGHNINFMGTDTLRSIQFGRKYYNASMNGFVFSVPASEHSVMTALGEEGEKFIFKLLLEKFPTGILSVVIDSYNYKRFVLEYAREFKDIILARNGKVVFRPDSGDPTAVTIEVLDMLGDVFGTSVNKKGYRILNPKVGVLWGDGIDYVGVRSILFSMMNVGWSASNIVFGMGGALQQKINRDTQRFAFKSSAQKRAGQWHDIFKNPLDSTKKSKKGRLQLIKNEQGKFSTVEGILVPKDQDQLVTVFENGELLVDYSFDQVRKNAAV